MSARFLNERLVATRRFQPKEAGEAGDRDDSTPQEAQPGAASADEVPGPGRDAALEALLRAEEQRTKHEALAHDLVEARRRRDELLEQLGDAIAGLEKDAAALGDRTALLQQRRESIRALELSSEECRELSVLRLAKQELHHAHLELVKLDRDSGRRPDMSVAVASLSLAQITRVGLGLTWPLLLVILAAAAGMIAAVLWVF